MTTVMEHVDDVSIVSGRAFARMSGEGCIDGADGRGIYDGDLRLLRRVQVHRAGDQEALGARVAIAPGGCAVSFDVPQVQPGTGILLVVEVDGTDLLTVRDLVAHHDAGATAAPAPGSRTPAAHPVATVHFDASCDGLDAPHRDGVALAADPVIADGTARTASWRWTVPADRPRPVDLHVRLRASWSLDPTAHPSGLRDHEQLEAHERAARNRWLASLPRLSGVEDVEQVVDASLADLASLRLDTPDGAVLAAGVPWYLTVLGRDSLLAAWMALPVDPDLAASTLRHLARHQATVDDPDTDAEPGKVLHEERQGAAAARWHGRYYGSVDSTPLFVMLLAESCRWSGDTALAVELEDPARAAVEWILARLEEDELGLLGYERRARTGLDAQSWKDSPGSQLDHAGRPASGRIRPLEVQAYAVAALRGAARLATTAWSDDVRASEWAASARMLERRMLDRFLVELPASQLFRPGDPRAGGFLAQGVDSMGLAIDSLCSNVGHVLWADAVADPLLRTRIIEQLSHVALDSGWGIRTMSDLDAGHDPASRHCGSVWPHDTAICVAGIARYDRGRAAQVGRNLLDAALGRGGRLPQLLSGAARRPDQARPDVLPVACSPHAWAAAAPLLVLRALLGIEPDQVAGRLTTTVGEAPAWLAGLRWRGVHAMGRRWDVDVHQDGAVEVVELSGS